MTVVDSLYTNPTDLIVFSKPKSQFIYIKSDFGYVLIQKVKKLYEGKTLRIDLDEMSMRTLEMERSIGSLLTTS